MHTRLLAAFTIASFVTGCAITPNVLLEARNAYSTSTGGLAGKLAPTELYDAKKALDQANREFDDHGDSAETRDYAYIAQRKIELANVKARTALDRMKITEAEKAGVVVRDRQAAANNDALADARAELKQNQRESAEQTRSVKKSIIELDAERQEKEAAEQRLAGAMAKLATVATVRDEPRGQIITLSGSELFATGQNRLLDTATARLDQVATALIAQPPIKRMVVEGHTDNRGSDAKNVELSLARANAVREYLVARGVDATKITARGLGSSQPVGENESAESRASNRRVEIVITPTTFTQR
jgi:outer membrane protein OmpA-like peptidoglycan-associated protein